jgi:ubiquinone/menaquinone biosynthesis C-methylase UbiE
MSAGDPCAVCPAEHAGWLTTPLRRVVTDPRRILGGLVAPGDTVIDLGCGPGFFTLPLAEMVGEGSSVIAIDVQDAMLDKLRERADKRGLLGRIRPHRCGEGSLELGAEGADFALAFWMVHEVPDAGRFFAEVRMALRPGGRLLLVEPRGHVGQAAWEGTLEAAAAVGFAPVGRRRVAFSRTALLERSTA